MNYEPDVDAGVQLLAELTERNIVSRKRLEPAAKLAGRALELLRPHVAAMTKKGFFASPCAHVPLGCILILLANAKKVVTIYLMDRDDRMEVLGRGDAEAASLTNEELLYMSDYFVKKYGALPGKKGPICSEDVITNLVCGLFRGDGGRETFSGLDTYGRQKRICPAAVGLIGRGLSGAAGSYSGVWPLLMPLAPYQGVIEEMMDAE
jgi:hypothetical protein